VELVVKFQAPAPALCVVFLGAFWLRIQNNLVQKIKKHHIICISSLPHKLFLWKRNPNFRLQFHHLKVFGSGFSHPKLLLLRAAAPPPQPCCKDGLRNLIADCSSVGLYCVRITCQQRSLQVTVVGIFQHVTRAPTAFLVDLGV